MRSVTLLLAVALPICLLGCAKDPRERLQGKWKGDSVTNVTAEQLVEATSWAKGVSFEFTDKKLTVTVPSEKPRTAEYEIEDAKDGEITVRLAKKAGEAESAKLTFVDKKLHWGIGQDRDIVLTRVD